jgi:hypothetical protein
MGGKTGQEVGINENLASKGSFMETVAEPSGSSEHRESLDRIRRYIRLPGYASPQAIAAQVEILIDVMYPLSKPGTEPPKTSREKLVNAIQVWGNAWKAGTETHINHPAQTALIIAIDEHESAIKDELSSSLKQIVHDAVSKAKAEMSSLIDETEKELADFQSQVDSLTVQYNFEVRAQREAARALQESEHERRLAVENVAKLTAELAALKAGGTEHV